MRVVDLPDDILRLIFDYLRSAKLKIASLVCQHFRLMAQPLLYRKIKLEHGFWSLKESKRVWGDTAWATDFRRQAQLLETLARCPELGHNTIVFRLNEYGRTYNGNFGHQAKLLESFPRLLELSLRPPMPGLDLTCHLSLERVRFVFGEPDIYPGAEGGQLISRNFFSPSLRTLSIQAPGFEYISDCVFPPETYQSSPVTDLRLNLTFREGHSMKPLLPMLRSIKSLKRFALDFDVDSLLFGWEKGDPEPPENDIYEWFFEDDILLALLPFSNILEELSISASDASGLDYMSPQYYLKSFSALRRLAISGTSIGFCDGSTTELMLPPNLEELQVEYQGWVDDDYDDWLPRYAVLNALIWMKRENKLPSLRLVVWWMQMTELWAQISNSPEFLSPEYVEECVPEFDELGVRFEAVRETWFRYSPFGRENSNSTFPFHGPRAFVT